MDVPPWRRRLFFLLLASPFVRPAPPQPSRGRGGTVCRRAQPALSPAGPLCTAPSSQRPLLPCGNSPSAFPLAATITLLIFPQHTPRSRRSAAYLAPTFPCRRRLTAVHTADPMRHDAAAFFKELHKACCVTFSLEQEGERGRASRQGENEGGRERDKCAKGARQKDRVSGGQSLSSGASGGAAGGAAGAVALAAAAWGVGSACASREAGSWWVGGVGRGLQALGQPAQHRSKLT